MLSGESHILHSRKIIREYNRYQVTDSGSIRLHTCLRCAVTVLGVLAASEISQVSLATLLHPSLGDLFELIGGRTFAALLDVGMS